MDTATLRTQLQQTGFVLSKTSGPSMRPLIWTGQHCVAVTPLAGEPEPGDLLLFADRRTGKEKHIVHRLIEIRERGGRRIYITRGDNCLGCENVERPDIIGRVAEVHRLSGYRPWHAVAAKKFSVTDRAYLRYTRFWTAIWPARRICYLLRAYSAGALRRIKSILRK